MKKWVSFDEVKSKVSIKDILAHYGLLEGLNQKGDELIGLCPFHQETEGSFRANIAKNAFHCFGCKAKGNILDFVSLKEGVDIREAALLIQDWFKISSESPQEAPGKKKRGKSIESPIRGKNDTNEGVLEGGKDKKNPPLTFALKNLDPEHPYLLERGLTKETIETFGLGYCSRGLLKNWIAIPIHNEKEELVAYAGRWPGEDPPEDRYKLPPRFQKSLVVFNLNRAKKLAKEKGLILVEGFFGCFKVWQAGFKSVAALMGTSMSPEQEELIAESVVQNGRVVLMFDGDEAGQSCTDQVVSRLVNRAFVKAVRLEPGSQPDKLSQEEIKKLLA
jgi:DNA primase